MHVYIFFQIEKTVSHKSTSKKTGQCEFKARYFQLCEELREHISGLQNVENMEAQDDEEESEENEEGHEFTFGDMIIWIDKDERSVIDVIRKKKGLPPL